MIAPNTIVGGRYRVVKPLGGGGMKLVYLAEDLRLAARRCALAEVVDNFTNPDAQRQAVDAFQREADMLARLNNEHIPRVFDRFSEQNRHYLVMEYIDGATLEEEMKQTGGRLAEARTIDIALQILATLEYLHGLEPPVIYRDLKPSNVMMMTNGQAKLIDFGIARHFQPQQNATMIGTQGYAPPEQYRGKVEQRSDLYALGATMHHALSGRDPANEAPFSFRRSARYVLRSSPRWRRWWTTRSPTTSSGACRTRRNSSASWKRFASAAWRRPGRSTHTAERRRARRERRNQPRRRRRPPAHVRSFGCRLEAPALREPRHRPRQRCSVRRRNSIAANADGRFPPTRTSVPSAARR